MIASAEVVERVKLFVQENFAYMRPDMEIADDASLIETGIIDSMGVMEMVDFLSAEFGVVVADTEITEENLGSLNAIGAYVAARQPAAPLRQPV